VALIVEDGSGVASADTYISLNDADTYHENRNNVTWAALSDDAKEGQLRLAAQMLDSEWRWKGVRVTATQARIWPRAGVTDNDDIYFAEDSVPTTVVEAQAELAVKLDYTQNIAQPSRLKRVKAGSVEVEYENPALPREVMSFVRALISEWLEPSGKVHRGP
jgi:hypothetical protein